MLGVLGTLFFVCMFIMSFWVLLTMFGFLPYWMGQDAKDKLKNWKNRKPAEPEEIEVAPVEE